MQKIIIKQIYKQWLRPIIVNNVRSHMIRQISVNFAINLKANVSNFMKNFNNFKNEFKHSIYCLFVLFWTILLLKEQYHACTLLSFKKGYVVFVSWYTRHFYTFIFLLFLKQISIIIHQEKLISQSKVSPNLV